MIDKKNLKPGVYRVQWNTGRPSEICIIGNNHQPGSFWIALPSAKGSFPLVCFELGIEKLEEIKPEDIK